MNNTQQIIKQAKELGYIPEKKETYTQNKNLIYDKKEVGFNQAIDSYNLEKIIELAYERGREEVKQEIMDMSATNKKFNINGIKVDSITVGLVRNVLLNNLSNKED